LEAFKTSDFEKLKVPTVFAQDNRSMSEYKGIIRGLHYQLPPFAQGKLVRCIRGSILDAVVDLQRSSKSFAKWSTFHLSEDNKHLLWIPVGFAHGFLTLSQRCEVQYKMTNEYHPQCERSIRWNDPEVGVEWGVEEPILNEKDKTAPFLKEILEGRQVFL
ncbi:MAG: dTDP-4-dehydrorhamnose 3,5-epimerase, partial [Deltaproteobacteria bacterium]|nr:dTDP-4-dehydrorhamnose 3,5-epimerase [Deltaproteobacteria bacterium]